MEPEKQTERRRWQLHEETVLDPIQEIMDRKEAYARQQMISAPTKHGVTKKAPQFFEDMARLRDFLENNYREIMLASMLLELVLLAYIAFK